MGDLFTRLFLNWRSSVDGGVLVVIAWLTAHGVTLSDFWTAKFAATAALLTAATWKIFSKDPEPPREPAS